jgi:anion-transporting  ArsA/GET3 family ATPase
MHVAVASSKGGVGKTTTATLGKDFARSDRHDDQCAARAWKAYKSTGKEVITYANGH